MSDNFKTTCINSDPLYDDKFPVTHEDFISYLHDGEYRSFLDEMNKLNKQRDKIYRKYNHIVSCRLSGNPIEREKECHWCGGTCGYKCFWKKIGE